MDVLSAPSAWKWYVWQWTFVCLLGLAGCFRFLGLSNRSDKGTQKSVGTIARRALEISSHMTCSFLTSKMLSCAWSWCQAFLSPHLSNLSPLYVGWGRSSKLWLSLNVPKHFLFFFFFANCLFALAYLLLVHELSHPTSNILVCSLALWHFSLNPFQTQGVSSYVALTNKIKTPWERSCLKRYFFLSLSFSPWVLLKVWYRRGDITIFKRKPFCDKCFLPGILKTWKLLWGPIEKEILLLVLDGKKTKWYIEGGFYSFTMLSGRFCFNMLITFILVEKPIVSLWTRWMNCKIDVIK